MKVFPSKLNKTPITYRQRGADMPQKWRKNWLWRYAHIDNFSTDIKSALATLSGEQK